MKNLFAVRPLDVVVAPWDVCDTVKGSMFVQACLGATVFGVAVVWNCYF